MALHAADRQIEEGAQPASQPRGRHKHGISPRGSGGDYFGVGMIERHEEEERILLLVRWQQPSLGGGVSHETMKTTPCLFPSFMSDWGLFPHASSFGLVGRTTAALHVVHPPSVH